MKNKIKVLDVGSDRDFIKIILNKCKNYIVEYLVIDPLPNFLEKFKNENKKIKYLKLKLYRYCVSGGNKKVNFFINSDPTTSSYYKANHKLLNLIRDDRRFDKKKIIKIKTLNLKKIFKKHSINNVDLLTLCTQGSELDIIKGLGKQLRNISLIRAHKDWVNKYDNEPLIGDLIGYLNNNGFHLLDIKPANKWFDKNITSDILFINKKVAFSKTKANKYSLLNSIALLIVLGKMTDVLILSRLNNLPSRLIKKKLEDFSLLYKLIINTYPYSKIIVYSLNVILRLLRIFGLQMDPPKFYALYKFLKVV
tara:strand:- start:262 stop:1185 length:924 start_codon:yes stop_codon:yes gene_type:complete